ncbi:MAG: M4 family metallopeptidase [Chitinophagaceae bacterium]|nr:M4 family metallopeptidase [Chitinophagaceae bacterium]
MTQNYPLTNIRGNRVWRLLSLVLLWQCLFVGTVLAQDKKSQPTLQDYCDPMENIEFFVFKKGVNFTKDEFLKQSVTLLKLTPGSEFKVIRSHTNDLKITSTFYQQYLNGYKIKGAEMVINEEDGRVKYVNGRYMTTEPMASSKTVSSEKALEIALNQINSKDYLWNYPESEAAYRRFKKDSSATYKPSGELIYFPNLARAFDQQQFRLVWRYAIHVNPQTESYELFIDAESGVVIDKIPLTFSCSTGTSTTLWNGAQNIYTQLNAGSYRTLDDCSSAQIHTYNGNGNDNGVGATYYTDADNAWPNTALGNYIAQTHYGNRATRNYYSAIHSRLGYDDAGADYVTYINPGYTGNAYWTGSGTSFGGSSTGASPYVTLDVCGHEHTHGMIDYTSNLTYSYESGALNESFADCIGEAVEDYTLGSADWIHRMEISGGNRSFISPNDKGDPDTYLGTNWYTGASDNGGVHTNSGVQNFWFYVLSVGKSGTNDNGDTYAVTGITIEKARMIAYDCMIGLISSSQYTNARSVSIQKAKDRYGDCSNEAKQCTNAWRAVGVGSAYIAPLPLAINVSTTATSVCSGETITVTASGASTYTWMGTFSYGSGNPKTFTITSTNTYTVTGTDAEDCTGTKSFTLYENSIPTVTPFATNDDLCPGGTTTLSASSNGTLNTILTAMDGTNGFSANVFNVYAYNSITITDFQMNIVTGDSAEVWYNPGGYGNANVTTTTGWIKLGSTVPITAAGAGNLTLIPTTVNLTIPAGSTYGIIVACNGSNDYSNGTLVGSIWESNPDLYITQGHGGSAFGGTFNLTNAPRCFNGALIYRTNYTNYSWTPSATLSSATSSVPTATPLATTTYTLTATDGNGCTSTGSVTVYVNSVPDVNSITTSPIAYCAGGSTQLTAAATSLEIGALTTTFANNNSFSGNVFDITASKQITITSVYINADAAVTQAEVWYKAGGIGGSPVTSSTGWTKLGNTVNVVSNGVGNATFVSLTTSLFIPAGQTFGLAVVGNGTIYYTNGTGVGNTVASNPDLIIKEGYGGSGFGGAFSFNASARIWNGTINYTVNNVVTNYSWSPSSFLSNSTISNPVASPKATTIYTLTITDGNGCTSSETKRVIVEPLPKIQLSATANSVCAGGASTLSITPSVTERDSLFTTTDAGNGFSPNGGVVFDIVTTKQITIQNVRMNIDAGATQAEVWYKVGGYGGATLTSNVGWTKLGATVAITPTGSLTLIPITSTLIVPANTTLGLAVTCNGSVNYTNGSAVGAVYASNPDLSIKIGHGGSGFGGTFNFINSPRVFNGEITYDVVNSLTSYSWSPATNINNTSSATPIVTPTSPTAYTVTVTDNNGCTNTASIGVNVMETPAGSVTATPSSVCLGQGVSLQYGNISGTQCNGVNQSNFSGTYAVANWTTTLTNSNGTVNTAGAPNSITMTSSNGLASSGTTGYQIVVPCSGYVTFNWNYSTVDAGPQYDVPRYSINGGTAVVFPGFEAQSGYPKTQLGTASIYVTGGSVFQLQAFSSDNIGGSCTVQISGFRAPVSSATTQTVAWYSAPTGGTFIGSANPQSTTPTTPGSTLYYAQITNTVSGCTNANRVASNAVAVNAIPVVTVSPGNSTICSGTTLNLTASGADTYLWQPGNLSGASINVTPGSTTTYTVTGTTLAGCTATAVRTITVNTTPTVSTSITNGIICSGQTTSITASGASTYTWQPGALSGTTVNVSPLITTTYTVIGTAANGCTASAVRLVTVNTTPTVSTSITNATICSGQSTSITASGANTYTWQPGALSGTTVNVSPASTTTYTVTGTASNGCTATATRLVTVNTTPTVSTSITNATICNGQSTSITASGASTYTWQPGALSGTTINVTPASTTTYTVTGTAANGCTATATRLVTVNTNPTVTTSATLTTINCPGSTTLSASGASTYTWQPGALSGTSVVVSPATTTTYTVTGTAANGCTATATRTITVIPCSNAVLNVKAFIEGYYIGGNTMNSVLNNQGLPNPLSHADSLTVELHQATAPYATAYTFKGVQSVNGNMTCTFPGAAIGTSYYLVLKHRNAIETWSASPVVAASSFSYDFSNNITKAYGSNQASLGGGVFGLFSGDLNQDMTIDVFDYLVLDPDVVAGSGGYLNTDVNGDGSVDVFDYLAIDPNIVNGVSAATP